MGRRMNRALAVILLLVAGAIAGVFWERHSSAKRYAAFQVEQDAIEAAYPTVCHDEGKWTICKSRQLDFVKGRFVPVRD